MAIINFSIHAPTNMLVKYLRQPKNQTFKDERQQAYGILVNRGLKFRLRRQR